MLRKQISLFNICQPHDCRLADFILNMQTICRINKHNNRNAIEKRFQNTNAVKMDGFMVM